MSDIPRYRPVAYDKYGITDDADGKLCEYRDYARLKAEVERLRKFSDEALAHIAKEERKSRECLDMAQAEVERLRASSFVTAVPVEQYERVVKAGDLLCFHYISLARKRWPDDPLPSSVTDWNAAKEGKQP
jgi:hypothetical protein